MKKERTQAIAVQPTKKANQQSEESKKKLFEHFANMEEFDGGMDEYAVDGDDYGVEDEFAINYGYGEEDFAPPTSNLPRDGRKNKNFGVDGEATSTPTTSNNNNGSHKVQDLVKGLKTSSSSNVESAMDQKPRILLMGLRRSGKSSIQKVVFQKMSPHETLFLESTNKIIKNGLSEVFIL